MAAACTGARMGSSRSGVSAGIDTLHDQIQRTLSKDARLRRRSFEGDVGSEGRTLKQRIEAATRRNKYNVENFYWREGFWRGVATNRHFESITLGIIGLNSIWIWIDTDYNPASTLLESHWTFVVVENLFCCFFVVEWFVRFMAFKRKFDTMKDSWFRFDSLLVLAMIAETWIVTAYLALWNGAAESNLGAASVLRLFRLLRLTRLVKMLRSMTELMILVKGMLSAVRSVGTVFTLLVIVMYVFGIAMTQLAVGTHSEQMYFSDVWHSMYTLLLYGVFLDSIAKLCNAVARDGDFYGYTLVFFIFMFVLVATLTVLNMLIGVLCEVVSRVAERERDDIEVAVVTSKLKRVVEVLDEDGNLRISQSEFMQLLGNREALLALKAAEIDPEELVDNMVFIFSKAEVKDDEDEPALSFQDFVEVLLELRGSNVSKVRDVIKFQKHIAAQFQAAKQALVPASRVTNRAWKAAIRRNSTRNSVVDRQGSSTSITSKISSNGSLCKVTDTFFAPASPSECAPVSAHTPPSEKGVEMAQVDSYAFLADDGTPFSRQRPPALHIVRADLPGCPPSPPSSGSGASRAAPRGAQGPNELCKLQALQARTTRVEDMLTEIVREVRGLSERVDAQQRRARRRGRQVADSTGGISG